MSIFLSRFSRTFSLSVKGLAPGRWRPASRRITADFFRFDGASSVRGPAFRRRNGAGEVRLAPPCHFHAISAVSRRHHGSVRRVCAVCCNKGRHAQTGNDDGGMGCRV